MVLVARILVFLKFFLTELKAEALAASWCSTKVETLSSHPMTTHASHASTKECLEDAVRINIMETVTSTILQILTTVIHPPLLLITEDSVGLTNLKQIYYVKNIVLL